ncbi:serine hydrolase domain-containing protein [Emticicia agri]|uniref:Class A beta-lactamase-related serine hydrolase n=1 Tax=Emticicia agri TaxID=2492393 RepID=A0A4Q5LYC8_9BACT|nr:serine hydrolase domain-containing protein [Emticicia agri]RYU94794.1 class A beta-lactamase-related serine hydrolase [Emticicia agri]
MRKIILLLLMANVSFAQLFQKKLDSLLQAHAEKDKAGMAVLVMKNGKTLYKEGFGLSNIDTQTPITPETNFRMASVSKQFTAACIILLENKKKLSYEDNLLKFFPDFNKEIGSQIQIKHLLTHTSGILDYEELIPDNQKEQLSDADVLQFLKVQTKTYFKAGSKFRYSNSGFCLLEQIIEKASGQNFVTFIKANVFEPLGMNNSTIYEAGRPMLNRAMGYARDKSGKVVFADQSITSATKGDGCVYSSLEDYSKWYQAIASNRLFHVVDELKKINHLIEGNKDINYGLGWFNGYGDKGIELYHTGSTCGFSNVVNVVPGKQFLFVYFSNIADNHSLEKPIRDLLRAEKIDNTEIDFAKVLSLTN